MKQILIVILSLSKAVNKGCWNIYSLLHSIIFNFSFLPFSQAVHLPIWLEKPKYRQISGLKTARIIIGSSDISFKMIKLGVAYNSFIPQRGITLQLLGTIIFHGKAQVGNDSCIYVRKGGVIDIGDNLLTAGNFRIICLKKVTIGRNALIGWSTQIMDTDFHRLTNSESGDAFARNAPVVIGNDNWIGSDVKIYKGFKTNDNIVIAAGSRCKQRIVMRKKSVIGEKSDITTIAENTYYNKDNDIY